MQLDFLYKKHPLFHAKLRFFVLPLSPLFMLTCKKWRYSSAYTHTLPRLSIIGYVIFNSKQEEEEGFFFIYVPGRNSPSTEGTVSFNCYSMIKQCSSISPEDSLLLQSQPMTSWVHIYSPVDPGGLIKLWLNQASMC